MNKTELRAYQTGYIIGTFALAYLLYTLLHIIF